MSVPPIDTPVSSFEVRCRVGQFVMDSDDEDRAPDLIAVGGKVTIAPDLRRPIRVMGENGPRVVHVSPLEFTIDPATGKLVHPDGDAGVELIDPTDEHLDPQGWTYTATVRPEQGRSWDVTFSAPTDGDVVDLGGIVSVAPSPGVTENHVQQAIAARDQAETFAVRAETAATDAEDWAPSFDWDGTALIIDGGEPVDLKGDGSSWAELTGKPATYPSTIPEVDGLAARLAALEQDTGVRNIGSLFINGWERYAYTATLQRIGPWCEIRAYVSYSDATDDRLFDLPPGFRPGGYSRPIGTIYGSSTIEARAFTISPDSISIPRSRLTQTQYMLSAVWITRDPWPTTLPGTPA